MTEKILVVDDEPLILTAVVRALSKVGYSVAGAKNISEVEEALKAAPFDLLITDVYMQEASSDTVIENVRRTSPAVKVIRMSGAVNKDRPGHFIEKPFSIVALRAMVKDILHESS